MRRLVTLACAASAAFVLAARPDAQTANRSLPAADPAALGFDAARLDAAESLLRDFVTQMKIAGYVAAVARDGKVARVMAGGAQDLAARRPMTERSIFRIYSMTKPVTSVAAMMLHEQGKFALTDPVEKYLPEFSRVVVEEPGGAPRKPARPITIADLMLHTSGLNHRTSDEYRAARVRNRTDSLPQFIANMVRVPLKEDPGTRFRYSEATTVLGRLVEIWAGQPFDEFLAQKVFAPLGMTDTVFVARADQRDRLTTAYAPSQTGGGLTAIEIETVPFTERPALIEGAVGLLSTVPDFLRFSQMLVNKGELDGIRLLQPSTVERLTANGLPADVLASRRGGGVGWGLGNVDVVMDPARAGYPARRGEYGWDGTAGTIFWIDPDRRLITILMTQIQPANPDRIRQQFKTLVEASVVH